jgi:hypothetical protein
MRLGAAAAGLTASGHAPRPCPEYCPGWQYRFRACPLPRLTLRPCCSQNVLGPVWLAAHHGNLSARTDPAPCPARTQGRATGSPQRPGGLLRRREKRSSGSRTQCAAAAAKLVSAVNCENTFSQLL